MTNEPPFKPGDIITWCDTRYEVIANHGDSGTVKEQGGGIVSGFRWVFEGEQARRVAPTDQTS
jgi:hypothetical protein